MLRRRAFLLGCGAVAAARVLDPLAANGAATVGARLSDSMRKATFLALVDEPVQIRRADGSVVRARVVEVRDGLAAPRLEQFSVRLRGPKSAPLSAGLYTIAHPTAGVTQVFLQPARADHRNQYYRIDCSLLV